ncbi:MAG TPA: pyrroloquinoline quinone biosynthesis protein PqqB [Ferrovibrio sp.]|uniref:pyrroloquinoline quinone biosynthesis protein PqqB n=1 Tax=Ferrovibrio sp. TaxID=1917215 RepID=UPI002ED562AA
MEVVVLGSAAGGGFPQWNCNAATSAGMREGRMRARARTQVSLAVSADGERWLLLNASPDFRQQVAQTQCLWPKAAPRHSPVEAVLLTGAEIDQVAGLLSMRESQPFTLWATERVHSLLAENPIFSALNPAYVGRRSFALSTPFEITGANGTMNLMATAYAVPGKVPLFLEGRHAENLAGGPEDTIGVEISGGGGSFHYIPGCARMTQALRQRLRDAALVFFDGTLWSDDELIKLEISSKTGQRMGHMSISGEGGTIAAFANLGVRRKILVHINTTNPILDEDSKERRILASHGWEVGEDGMRISL